MVDNALLTELLRQFEVENGCAVQVRIEPASGTPQYFGAFATRPLTVQRVAGIDEKYHSDIQRIERRHDSYQQLEQKVEKLNNILYKINFDLINNFNATIPGFKEFYDKNITHISGGLIHSLTSCIYYKASQKGEGINRNELNALIKIKEQELYDILNQAKVQYLQHELKVDPSGIYDITEPGNLPSLGFQGAFSSPKPDWYKKYPKIADISIELIK